MSVHLRCRRGTSTRLAVDRWAARASEAEAALLAGIEGPVLDLGCGPGRLVVALAENGTPALGVDASPAAAALAERRGAPVLCRSIFDPLPGEGRWRSVLLLDGNVGIGGDPTNLLRRAASLLAPRGSLLVELGAPGSATEVTEARVDAHGELGPWFPWAWVAADGVERFAGPVGLEVGEWLRPDGRWIARLVARVDVRGRHSRG